MRSTTASIDLGELPRGGSGEETAEPPWPGRQTDWRRWAGGHGRPRWPALAITAGLALTTAGAATPPTDWATLQFTIPADGQAVLTGNHLYVIDELGRGRMSAYRLADGTPEWTLTHSEPESWFDVRGDLPIEIAMEVVSTGDDQFSYADGTTVFDPDTGQARWAREGTFAEIGDNGLGVFTHDRPSGWRSQLTTVDLATGQELWAAPPVASWRHSYHRDHARELVTLTGDGELTSYDLATGTRLASTRTVAQPTSELQLVAGSLVLLQGPEPETVSAYDLATLDHRWSTDLPWDGWLLSPCGPVLCVQGGAVPLALDPATGATAWSADWLGGTGTGSRDAWVTQPVPPWPADLLLVAGWVIEAATGEPVLELRDWAPLGLTGPMLGRPDSLLARYEPPAESGNRGRTWFGRIRSDPVRLQVLGAVDGLMDECVTAADHLACQRFDELLVWRFRG